MKKVLFVCIGNAFRSQIAEAFANAYGSGMLKAESAGLAPVLAVPEITKTVMREKGIEMDGHFPKALVHMDLKSYDLIVNLSGMPLHAPKETPVLVWNVPDPVGEGENTVRQVRDQIEQLVTGLLLQLRSQQQS
jgi:protein-tyrosine-phosphatase